jgi:hypothetical protein
MARDKAKEKEALKEMLGVRGSSDDLARLDAPSKWFPIGMRHAIARFARRIGFDASKSDPAISLGTAVKVRNALSR